MCIFAVAVRARGYVILYADNVYVYYIDRHVRFIPFSRSIRFKEYPSSNPMLRLAKVYFVGASNFTSLML